MVVQERSDQEIIQQVLKGEVQAYNSIVDAYKSLVFTIIFKILKNEEDAEEAAQDTFIKAYQSLSRFNFEAKFSTWLYRIAFNTAISYKRKNRIEVSGLDHLDQIAQQKDQTLDSIKVKEQQAVVNDVVRTLSPVDAAIVTLFYLQEKSLVEVSEVTGLTESAIKVKLFRARKKMAKTLKEKLLVEAEAIL